MKKQLDTVRDDVMMTFLISSLRSHASAKKVLFVILDWGDILEIDFLSTMPRGYWVWNFENGWESHSLLDRVQMS